MKAFNQLKEAVAPKDPEPPKTPKNTQTSNTDTRTPTKSTKAPSKPTAMSTKKDEKTSYYPIVGILPGKGVHDKVPVRMEVDEWWDSKDPIHINQQSLLLQAFNKLYSMSPHDKLSFYQIAGIHNQPLVPWDGGEFPGQNKEKNYCFHSTPNFPTWHRPYVVLLEQRLYEIMVKEIIPGFPKSDQADLKKAAEEWRFPFWDWAMKKKDDKGVGNYDVPKVARLPEVEVRVPGGTSKIPNPFYQFVMPDGKAMGDEDLKPDIVTREPYTRTKASSRHPYDEGAKEDEAFVEEVHAKGIVNNDGVKDDLQSWKWESGGSLSGSLRDWFYRIILIEPYPEFATKKADLGGVVAGKMSALEDIHDDLHSFGGGTFGHMGAPAIGSFDPMFWLHHCQVDRMLEIWAAIHPELSREWLENDELAKQALVPFRTNKYGDYHTARTSWHPEAFGYTYPETKRWEERYQTDGEFDEKKLDEELTILLNEKYNSAAQAAQRAELSQTKEAPKGKTITKTAAGVAADVTDIRSQIEGAKDVMGAAISAIPGGAKFVDKIPETIHTYDYVANVIYEKYALDGDPFTIRIFIGEVPDAHNKEVSQAVTQVGELYNFVDRVEYDEAHCKNCADQKEEHIQLTGSVPLTNALLTRHKQQIPHESESGETSTLKSMDPKDVIPFLTKHLHWRVTDREGTVIDKTKITGLKVSVAMASTDHHKDPSKFSEWGDYKILYDITAGFDAGLAPEDDLFPDVPALTMDGMGLADLLPKMPGKTETKGGAQGGKGGSKTVTAKISGEITIELSDGTVDLSGLTIKL